MARNRLTKTMERLKDEIELFESSRAYYSYDDLASFFQISKSTVYQDLYLIRNLLRVSFERKNKNGKGIRFEDGYFKKVTYTAAQQQALIKSIKNAETKLDKEELISILRIGSDCDDEEVKAILND